MNCKNCGAELPEENGICTHCGEDNSPVQLPAEEGMPLLFPEEEVVIVPGEAPEAQEQTVSAEELAAANKGLKKMKRIAAVSGCIAGLAVLATVLFFGIRGGWDVLSLLKPRENNVQYKDSYSVSDEKAEEKGDQVVATMPGAELTNSQLQMFYWMQVYDFVDYYGYYLSYIGMDYTAPLDEQAFDEEMTWQQYFLDSAIDNWRTYTALTLTAEKNGYKLEEEYQALLDNLEAEMLETAKSAGYSSADELIQNEMGAGCTFQDYYEYLRLYYTGYSYFSHLYEQLEPSDSDIETYFTNHEATFAGKDITKESGKYVDVRHILVLIEELETEPSESSTDATDPTNASQPEEDDGNYGYSQAAWDVCQAEAQAILDAWLSGEKTEASFGTLANEKSDDNNGNVTNGGLYENVKQGDMVQPFNDWIFDETRKPGDYGLVKTQFGYHVMYFVGGEEIWYTEAKNALLSELSTENLSKILEDFETETNYKKIAIAVVELG